jgi:galactose mutarotase-like enzyme
VDESENVLIRAGDCTVVLLPRFGGKIASIKVGEHELLQAPLAPVAPRTRTMGFDQSDASGWDECLPSVAECTVKTAAGEAKIPDHGDLWIAEWEVQGSGVRDRGSEGGAVTLVAKCFSLPLEVERTVGLSETGTGWRLDVNYKLKNVGKYDVPWSWAAHPLYVAAQGDRIVLPKSVSSLRLEGSGGERLGKGGDTVAWPVAKLAGGGTTDLSVAESPDSGIGDKLFAGPLSAADNWCALERPSVGLRLRVRFDTAATPYLGLWICYGGWPERPGPKQVCVAMEPSTAPVDSLAVNGPWSRLLAADATFAWPMEVEIERMGR